jgi:predicted NBD/HSP70 family sugar kinase
MRTKDPEWPVLNAILAQGALSPTHDALQELSGVGSRSINNVIGNFSAGKLITGGHPARLGPGLGLMIGLSLGVESLRGALVDANGESHCEMEDDLSPGQLRTSSKALVGRLRQMAGDVLSVGLEDPSLWGPKDRELRLLGVAVAWPSPIDRDKRPVGKALSDGSWRKPSKLTTGLVSLPELVSDNFGKLFPVERCHALNDVSAIALAVAFDTCRERAADEDDDRWRVELVVRVGGSIGASTVLLAPHARKRLSFIDSKLIEGTNGLAGELGHLPIGRRLIEEVSSRSHHDLAPMDYDSWTCSCNRLHHLEAFASGAAVMRRLKASGYDIPDEGRGRMSILRSALDHEPDDVQKAAVTDVGRVLGRALAGPILMFDPFRITVTGSLATSYLVDGIGRERDMWANAIKDAVVVEPRGGNSGRFLAVRGAALAVLRKQVFREFLDRRGPAPKVVRFGAKQLDEFIGSVRA